MKIFLCEYFKPNDKVIADDKNGDEMTLKQKASKGRNANFLAAGFALAVYIIGGLSVMIGLGLIGILGAQELWGWGEARSIGYLVFAVGLIMSILGVLIMRIMRNRRWA